MAAVAYADMNGLLWFRGVTPCPSPALTSSEQGSYPVDGRRRARPFSIAGVAAQAGPVFLPRCQLALEVASANGRSPIYQWINQDLKLWARSSSQTLFVARLDAEAFGSGLSGQALGTSHSPGSPDIDGLCRSVPMGRPG
jgi:hypothetical protein